MHTDQKPIYRTAEQIAQLVEAVEGCLLAPTEFGHHAHMTVAIWYLARLPIDEATTAMRATIQRFAAHHGHHQLYHETITLFWMQLLRHYLDAAGSDLPLADLAYHAIVELGSMQPAFRHYSRELLFSDRARREWVAPDLLAMPAGTNA
jgi:hypothetical protein